MKISKQRIQFYMAEQRLTTKKLAEKIGMMPQNLSGILSRGSCQPVTAARIADGLGVDVADIVEKED